MAYVGNNYTATDVSSATIDLVGTIGVALVGFASLIGLVLLFKWVKKK